MFGRRVLNAVTSDGISTEDWGLVHELAVEVVNRSAAGDASGSKAKVAELLGLLDTLEERYGCLPSLLATRADYVDGPEEREYYLLQAYSEARALDDAINLVRSPSRSRPSISKTVRTIGTALIGSGCWRNFSRCTTIPQSLKR